MFTFRPSSYFIPSSVRPLVCFEYYHRSFRVNKRGAGWAPYVEFSDLKPEAVVKLAENDKDLIKEFKESMSAMGPCTILTMAPTLMIVKSRMYDVFAYNGKVRVQNSPW